MVLLTVLPDGAAVSVPPEESKEGPAAESKITYRQLYGRLKLYKDFPVNEQFWSLSCWAADNASQTVTEEEFIGKYANVKGLPELEVTLRALQEEQRISVPEEQLVLTRGADDGEDKQKNLDDDAADPVAEESASSSNVNSSSEEQRQRKFYENVLSIDGVPKDLLESYMTFSRVTQIILRTLILILRKKSLSSPLDVARELFQDCMILFAQARSNVEVQAQQENQKYLRNVQKNKKNDVALKAIEVEYKLMEISSRPFEKS